MPEKTKRIYRRRKRRPGSLKWLMPFVFLLLFFVAGYFFIHSAIFNISSITVSGSKNILPAEIIKVSGLHQGENIFQADLENAQKKILTQALIKSAHIQRKFPKTIEINVEERVPLALVPVAGGLLQVDAQGCVLRKQEIMECKGLMIITGISIPPSAGVGSKINSRQLQAGLKLVSQMDADIKKMIGEIDISDLQKLRAYTTQGAEVRLGSGEDMKDKFNRLLQVIREEEKLNKLDKIQYIDLSFSGKPVVYYRK